MRKHVAPPRHRIDTTPVQPEPVVDTSSFDAIAAERLMRVYEERYAAVLPRMIEIAMGQLAMDRALKNIEHAMGDVHGDLRPATPENHATIEAAHMQAYRYAVISAALTGTVPAEHVHETTLRFMEGHSRATSADPSLRKLLSKAMQDAGVAPSAGVQPQPHADDGLASPYGIHAAQPTKRRGNRVKA